MQKIRVAIIGLGNIAHGYDDISSVKKRIKYPTHLSVLKKDRRFELIAAADTSVKQRRLFKKKVSASVKIYADYHVLLSHETIDLLVVAVSTAAHYAVCTAALRAGVKNILCEKPVTRTLGEAKKMQALAKRRRARLLINYQRSYSQGYARFINSARQKKWGRILSVIVRYDNGVYNTATHFIHLLEKMFGPIQKVQSLEKRGLAGADPNVSFTALARGFNISFEGIGGTAQRLAEIDLKFEKKRVMLNGDSFTGKSMLDVYANVYQVINHNKKPEADVVSSVQALKVAEKAIESARTGKLINI